MLRYYMRYDDDLETARALCILFLPFSSELEDIHEKNPQLLVAENSSLINANREKFEKNQYIFDLIKEMENNQTEDQEQEEDEVGRELETTENWEIEAHEEDYDKAKAKGTLPKDDTSSLVDVEELRKQIIKLNIEQRRVFDEICERVNHESFDDNPFYNFLAGEAGVGKSFLVKVLIEAIKYLKTRAGLELDKPLVLTMAPTAVAAWLINGKTIESALGINMNRFGGKIKYTLKVISFDLK